MPICHKNKFVFFHIPRCGGTSLDCYYKFHDGNPLFGFKYIDNQLYTLHHLTYEEIKKQTLLDDETLNSFFKFTIIRDPFRRMVSDYIWQQNHDIHDEFKHLSFQSYLDKAEWVVTERLYFKKLHYDHFRPMHEYCYWNGKRVMDEILILENIERELLRVGKQINLDKMPHENGSIYELDVFSTEKNISRVYQLYHDDKELHDQINLAPQLTYG